MKKNYHIGCFAIGVMVVALMPALASATDINIPVSVMLDYGNSCQVQKLQDIAFGTPSLTVTSGSAPGSTATIAIGAAINANGVLTVNCTSGLPYNVYAPASGNESPASQRRLRRGSSSDYINYTISMASTGGAAVPFNQGSATASPYARTGGGYADAITVYGRVPAQTLTGAVGIGSYSDTFNLTVYY
jgi:spore coat protein U-like protein